MDNFTKLRLTRDLSDLKKNEMGISSEAHFGLRILRIDDLMDGRFYLCEYFPVPRHHDESIDYMEIFQRNPNHYQDFIHLHAPDDPTDVVKMSFGVGSTLYHASLESAISCAIEAVERNVPVTEKALVEEYRAKQPEWLRSIHKEHSVSASIQFLEECKIDARDIEPSLFDDKMDLFGNPIPRDVRVKMLSYINAPSLDLWMVIRSLPITPMATLWHMLELRHPTHPFAAREALRSDFEWKEEDLPTGEMVKALLYQGIELNNEFIEKKIERLKQLEEVREKPYDRSPSGF